jgi:hypothetical protein
MQVVPDLRSFPVNDTGNLSKMEQIFTNLNLNSMGSLLRTYLRKKPDKKISVDSPFLHTWEVKNRMTYVGAMEKYTQFGITDNLLISCVLTSTCKKKELRTAESNTLPETETACSGPPLWLYLSWLFGGR